MSETLYPSRRLPAKSRGILAVLVLMSGCAEKQPSLPTQAGADADGHEAATAHTISANNRALDELPFAEQQDFEEARRGLIATDAELVVTGVDGSTIWDQTAYEFINTTTSAEFDSAQVPDSVHPSLWRQAQLNNIHGLFEVTPGIYQLRGFDLANLTLIDGNTGWILVDPLTTRETASRALEFAREHLGDKPISAIIYTHSHIDHFGGVLGVLPEEQGDNIPIIAPDGFLQEAVSENVLAGPTMARRSDFMYGRRLAKTERGHVDTGLGKAPAFGSVGIVAPTITISSPLQNMEIDGVQFVFQLVSGSEAPAEMTFYLPEFKAFCGAEMLSRTMHNLYTLRGAKVRDALAWSGYIDQSIDLFSEADIYFASHHWPIWGSEQIVDFLEKQRDTYKYIHDQTLRLAYKGLTPGEIAEQLELPESLRTSFSNRGYYGTLKHNSRAVYQAYFGWYDGNPANLDPLPPVDSGKRYVSAMGGAESVQEMASAAFDEGDYRWVAQLLNHLVFADPQHQEARILLARTYDQLGYQAESGPWRDSYLTAAYELRLGPPSQGIDLSSARDMVKHTPREHFLNVMAAQIDGPAAGGLNLKINVNFTDLNENHVLTLKNAVLNHRLAAPDAGADVTINITHKLFLDMALGTVDVGELIFSDQLNIEGSRLDLVKFFSLQDKSDGRFPIVTP